MFIKNALCSFKRCFYQSFFFKKHLSSQLRYAESKIGRMFTLSLILIGIDIDHCLRYGLIIHKVFLDTMQQQFILQANLTTVFFLKMVHQVRWYYGKNNYPEKKVVGVSIHSCLHCKCKYFEVFFITPSKQYLYYQNNSTVVTFRSIYTARINRCFVQYLHRNMICFARILLFVQRPYLFKIWVSVTHYVINKCDKH